MQEIISNLKVSFHFIYHVVCVFYSNSNYIFLLIKKGIEKKRNYLFTLIFVFLEMTLRKKNN